MVLVLTKSDLEYALSMRETIAVIEEAFTELAQGMARVPPRSLINMQEQQGILLTMSAYLAKSKSLVVKAVSVFDQNPVKYGMPTVFAIVIFNDSSTGKPLAIMDGQFLTAMRTGAGSGVATKYLARSNSEIVGIIGAGVQSRTQLLAVCEVREVKKALIYDVIRQRSHEFAMEMSKKLGIDILQVDRAEKAVKGVDILITATTAKKPVINGVWIKPGTHINSIGWMGPDARELDTDTVRKSKLIVDSREAVLSESGDILIPIKEGAITKDHIYSELGEIVVGKKEGRTSEDEITLWKGVGIAIQDAAAAKLAYERAVDKKLGTQVVLV